MDATLKNMSNKGLIQTCKTHKYVTILPSITYKITKYFHKILLKICIHRGCFLYYLAIYNGLFYTYNILYIISLYLPISIICFLIYCINQLVIY